MPGDPYKLSEEQRKAAINATDAQVQEAEAALANGTHKDPERAKAMVSLWYGVRTPARSPDAIASEDARDQLATAEDMRGGQLPQPGQMDAPPSDLAYVQAGGFDVGRTQAGGVTATPKPWEAEEQRLAGKTKEKEPFVPGLPYETPRGDNVYPVWWFDPEPPEAPSPTGMKATTTFASEGDLGGGSPATPAPPVVNADADAKAYADAEWQKASAEAEAKGEWLVRWDQLPMDTAEQQLHKIAGYGVKAAASTATAIDTVGMGVPGALAQAAMTPLAGREGAAKALQNVRGTAEATKHLTYPLTAAGMFNRAGVPQALGTVEKALADRLGMVPKSPAARTVGAPVVAGGAAGLAFEGMHQGAEEAKEQLSGRPDEFGLGERLQKVGAMGALSSGFGPLAALMGRGHRSMSLNPDKGFPRRVLNDSGAGHGVMVGPRQTEGARQLEDDALAFPTSDARADPYTLGKERFVSALETAKQDPKSQAKALLDDLESTGSGMVKSAQAYEQMHLKHVDKLTDDVLKTAHERREASARAIRVEDETYFASREGQETVSSIPLIRVYSKDMESAKPSSADGKQLLDQFMPGSGAEASRRDQVKFFHAERHPVDRALEVEDSVVKPITIAEARRRKIRFDPPLEKDEVAEDYLIVLRPAQLNARQLEKFRSDMDKASRHGQFDPPQQGLARKLAAAARTMRGGAREGDEEALWASELGIEQAAYPTLAAIKKRQKKIIDEEHEVFGALGLNPDKDVNLKDITQRQAVKRSLEEMMDGGGLTDRDKPFRRFLAESPELQTRYVLVGNGRKRLREQLESIGTPGGFVGQTEPGMLQARERASSSLMDPRLLGPNAEKMVGYMPDDILLSTAKRRTIQGAKAYRELADAMKISISDNVAGLSKSDAKWAQEINSGLDRVIGGMDRVGVDALNAATAKAGPRAQYALKTIVETMARESLKRGGPRLLVTGGPQTGAHMFASIGPFFSNRAYPALGGMSRLGAGGGGTAMAQTARLVPDEFVEGLRELAGLSDGLKSTSGIKNDTQVPSEKESRP